MNCLYCCCVKLTAAMVVTTTLPHARFRDRYAPLPQWDDRLFYEVVTNLRTYNFVQNKEGKKEKKQVKKETVKMTNILKGKVKRVNQNLSYKKSQGE